jgi:probable F420-dependent oxidoreductase
VSVLGASGGDAGSLLVDLYAGHGLRLGEAAEFAAMAEGAGFSGLWTIEAHSEPFLPLAVAAEHTSRITLRTAVAVALARNPMIVAHLAHELSIFSAGRFELGLGPQVRGHITRRYGIEWSRPADRMKEFVQALHAIWACWNDDVPLDFRGEYYTHKLMTPVFHPGPCASGRPAVLLAAVGPRMLRVAAEGADGVIAHPLSSRRQLLESTLPALREARADSGSNGAFEVSCPVLVITGRSDEEMATARETVRKQVAFYASTPAYRGALALYDQGETADELRALSVQGEWDKMTALVTDELLEEFAVEAPAPQLRAALEARFTGVLDRVSLYAPYRLASGVWQTVMEQVSPELTQPLPSSNATPSGRAGGA